MLIWLVKIIIVQMSGITSKDKRPRSKSIFQCHCDRTFSTSAQLAHHAYLHHQQQVITLRAYLTDQKQVFQISRANRVKHSFDPQEGNQNNPINILDSPLQKGQDIHFKIDEEGASSHQQLSSQLQQITQKQLENHREGDEMVDSFEFNREKPFIVENEHRGGEQQGEQKLKQSPKLTTKSYRISKCLTQIGSSNDPTMQRCFSILSLFTSKNSNNFDLPGMDFWELIRNANSSKLCRQICRYIASWDIQDDKKFVIQSFTAMRDRLFVLSVMVQAQEAYLRWKGWGAVPPGEYCAFFNYFIVNFLPDLLVHRRMQKWMKFNRAMIFTHKDYVYQEIKTFLGWWNRNELSVFAIHRNPLVDFSIVMKEETQNKFMMLEDDCALSQQAKQ